MDARPGPLRRTVPRAYLPGPRPLLPIAGPVPYEIVLCLAKLAGGPPLWGDRAEGSALVDRMRPRACRWHGPAAAVGR
jgi:hypothetical protein